MSKDIKKKIIDCIEKSDTIVLCRHKRPDGDAVGSTLGLRAVLSAAYPEKRIFLDNEDYSDYVAFLGDEGEKPTDGDYKDALVIVLDTGNVERISSQRYCKGKKIVKIDHHIDETPYGDISWVEEERSSTCEMITDLCLTSGGRLKLGAASAFCLYTGMVTDSGRFCYRGTSADTMRCAAALLETGIDTEHIFAHLYIDELSVMKFRADLTKRIQITENGVAWLYISSALRKRRGLSQEDASNTVSIMSSIKGSLIWIAFIENGDGSIRVRLRSRFVEVQQLAARYHGGGHACAAGATVYNREERDALLAEADALLGAYKKENAGWI